MKTIAELYSQAVDALSRSGIESSEFDAMCMLEDCFGISRSQYLLMKNNQAQGKAEERFLRYVDRRAAREPLQYILGKWDFYKSVFFVGEGALIPRPETETLVERAIAEIHSRNIKICFDLCAGTGCIGLSIAKECPEAEVWLFEKYDAAFYYLEKNAAVFALPNVKTLRYDVFDGFDSSLMPSAGLLVSNPPYIPTCEISSLQAEVRQEPSSALDGGTDGLDFYRCIKERWLEPIGGGASVIFEAGEEQAGLIAEAFTGRASSYFNDAFGVERFIRIAEITDENLL